MNDMFLIWSIICAWSTIGMITLAIIIGRDYIRYEPIYLRDFILGIFLGVVLGPILFGLLLQIILNDKPKKYYIQRKRK